MHEALRGNSVRGTANGTASGEDAGGGGAGRARQQAQQQAQQQARQQERQERQQAIKTMLAYALLVDKQKAALLRGNYLTAARLGQQLYYHASEAYMAALDLATLSLHQLTLSPTSPTSSAFMGDE